MTRYRSLAASVLATNLGVLVSTFPAWAASPTKVTANWSGGATGLPSDVSMYIYVPTKVATNPPILTLIHYCGGSASAVFNQATGNGTSNGGVVQAADQYGFIIVVPDNGARCWDVTSTKTHTRNGGGDSHAIIQMVKYALTQYKGNAERVYSTGDSSGGMMTQLLLALYPDVYKGGSAFAGVPAGCSNEFDGSGLCGLPSQTAQQWGDRVRAMYSGYTGHRPRVQLVHGDADATITYKNMTQAINEWTNVLGLSATPTTTTSSGLTLGTHQATEKQWKNSCGYVVFDALTSVGGDHGPSDALFESKYVIPFLGLDKVGDTDPEIAQCSGGTGGTGAGGATSAGGTSAAGGISSTGGTKAAGGASSGIGGNTAAGGNSSVGGNPVTGGSSSTGVVAPTGGRTSASGGSAATGGTPGVGGKANTGGMFATGGSIPAADTGGTSSRPGTTGTGGSVANTGGLNGVGGSSAAVAGNSSVTMVGGSPSGASDNSGGCSCTVTGKAPRSGLLALALATSLLLRRRPRSPSTDKKA